jgi:hypothetical protein
MSVPWASFGIEGLPLNHAALWRREEALEEARARRDEEERRTRAEERHEKLLDAAMRAAWAQGRPFDPDNPTGLGMSHQEITAQVEAVMDREDRANELAELVGGGRGGWITMPLMPRLDPDPSEAEPKRPTAAQRAAADAEAREVDAQVRRTAVNDSARSVYRRLHQAQEHAKQRARERRQAEQWALQRDLEGAME